MGWPHSTNAHSMASIPPLTSPVKSSLFLHVHSSPLPLTARLHQCHANCSHYINNGWTFPGQTPFNINSFKHHNTLMRYLLIWSLFYRWGNWSVERLSNLPKVTQPSAGEAGIQTRQFSSSVYAFSCHAILTFQRNEWMNHTKYL